MANIIIKSDDRRKSETYVLQQFGKDCRTVGSGDREHAEYIAARTREAYAQLKKMEG